MADALGTKVAGKVVGAINKVGLAATWYQDPDPDHAYNVGTGKTTPNWTAYAVTVAPPMEYEQRYLVGDLIQAGDARTSIAAQGLTFTPRRGDKVLIGGVTWRVISLQTHQLAAVVVAYEAQLRR